MTRSYVYSDGGRALAGFTGDAGDCVTRAIAIALGAAYSEVYSALHAQMKQQKLLKHRKRSPRDGVRRQVYEKYLATYGWHFVPTMGIGTGCKVHLRADELPKGRLIARLSHHLVAVLDGVVYDTHDCSREGTRCVYGYYQWRPAPGVGRANAERLYCDPELERWESYVQRVTKP